MALNPEFMQILEKMKEIHSKKVEDYSSVGHYENFTRQASVMEWFKSDIDKAFAGLVTVKLARLATLLDKVDSPNFESTDDSFLDLTTYCALWASYHLHVKKQRSLGDFVNRDVRVEPTVNILESCRAGKHAWGSDGKTPQCVFCRLSLFDYLKSQGRENDYLKTKE